MGLGLEQCFKRRRTVGRIRSTLGERRPFWSRPYTVLLGVHHTQASLVGVLFLRHVIFNQVLGIRRGYIFGRDSLDGGIKEIKRPILDLERDLGRDARIRIALIDDHTSVGLFDGLNNGVDIERTNRARVNDLGAVAVVLETLSDTHGNVVALGVGHDGHIRALLRNTGPYRSG